MGIWVVSTLGLLGRELLWTFLCMFLAERVYAFLLETYLKVEMLALRACVGSAVVNTAKQFPEPYILKNF